MARHRSSKPDKKPQKIPVEYLWFVLLLLGFVFIVLRGRHPSSSASLSANAPAQTSSPTTDVEILETHEPQVDTSKYQAELNRQRAHFAQTRELGLKSLTLKGGGDTLKIPLVWAPRKLWCQGGDLDTMKYASKNDSSKDFLITLEGLGRGGKHPFVRTSLQDLYKGLSHTFTVSRPKEATSYGVFICSDSRNDNSCQRKSMMSHAHLSDELAEHPNQAKMEDRIFFFQNLVIDSRKVEAYRTDEFGNAFQTALSSHLTKKGLSASEVQTAWKTNSTLKSAPVDIRDGKIILSLPYNDPRCLQGKSR